MSYDTYEASREEGRPARLYRFSLNGNVWRYTSADHDVLTNDGNVWKKSAISDEGFRQSGEAVQDTMTITAPINVAPVQAHLVTATASAIQIDILQKHEDSVDVRVVYAGEITQIDTGGTPGQARMTCETTVASMQREGLRLGWQRSCPYALYDELTCKVPKSAYGIQMTVMAKSGFNLLVSDHGKESGWFSGGFLAWSDPTRGLEYRSIETQTLNQLIILGRTEDIYEGLVVTAYPGCSRTTSTCTTKFNNLPNYGGVPSMPGTSPFDGNPVF